MVFRLAFHYDRATGTATVAGREMRIVQLNRARYVARVGECDDGTYFCDEAYRVTREGSGARADIAMVTDVRDSAVLERIGEVCSAL